MPRRTSRIDKNQTEIIKDLRKLGYSVVSLSGVGGGCPDLLVAKLGITILVEVKSGNNQLKENQKDFFSGWAGICVLARTVDDVENYFHGRG